MMKKEDHDQGEVSSMNHPEDPDKKIKDVPHNVEEPDQSKKQINEFKDEVHNTNHPHEDLNKTFKNIAPKHFTPKPHQSKKQINQSKGEVDYMDHPEDTVPKFKGAPRNEALELEEPNQQVNQSEDKVNYYMDHPEGLDNKFKVAPQNEVSEPDKLKKQMNQSEGEVHHMDHVEDHGQKFRVTPEEKTPEPDQSKKQKNQSKGNNKISEDSPSPLSATLQDQGKGEITRSSAPEQPQTDSLKKSDLTAASQATVPIQPEIDLPDEKKKEHIEVKVDEVATGLVQEVGADESTPLAEEAVTSLQSLEILKSIVYGGLIESLASLTVVTSAASADATTLNIVALSIANLIGGLFVLGHNLEELKSEQVDRYNEILGQRKNFNIHALIAILSFIVSGLVPPVVYGFSFRESDDKDFKVAAVAGASLLCITLLSLAKAYVKRPNSYFTYFKTVLYYVCTGAVASVLSYLAGELVKKFIEELGWFESASNFALGILGIGVQQPRWGSY